MSIEGFSKRKQTQLEFCFPDQKGRKLNYCHAELVSASAPVLLRKGKFIKINIHRVRFSKKILNKGCFWAY